MSPVHNRLPGYRSGEERWLIPVVGDGRTGCPVLLWWVLLFGLSLLARYDPAVWRAALDLEQSPVAGPVMGLIDDALVILPDLLFEAATRIAPSRHDEPDLGIIMRPARGTA